MKTYEMHLMPVYFDLIKSGEKTLEGRLFSGDKKLITKGDEIIFYKNGDDSSQIKTKVLECYRFNNFDEMANTLSKKDLGFEKYTKEQMINTYRNIYPQEKELKNGVIVFKIKIIN